MALIGRVPCRCSINVLALKIMNVRDGNDVGNCDDADATDDDSDDAGDGDYEDISNTHTKEHS